MTSKNSRPYITLLMSAVGIATAERPITKLMFGVGAFLSWADIVNADDEPTLSGVMFADVNKKGIKFEWDKGNDVKNYLKHDVGRIESESIFDDDNYYQNIQKDSFEEYGEIRYICISISFYNRLVTAVYTMREDKVRIISIRQANEKESKIYQDTPR